jgi:hypothetical protein
VAGGGVSGKDFAPRCAGEAIVCDCGQVLQINTEHVYTCTRPGVCRANHAPTAFGVSVRFPWRSFCVPITIFSIDSDGDLTQFGSIVSPPQEGYVTEFVPTPAGRVVASGATVATTDAYPFLKFNGISNISWADDLPAPPLPDGTPIDCYPRCSGYGGTCRDSEGNHMGDCPGCVDKQCPEGEYRAQAFCYVPFQTTYTGVDSFQFAAIDQHGAQSAPVTVAIEIYDDRSQS